MQNASFSRGSCTCTTSAVGKSYDATIKDRSWSGSGSVGWKETLKSQLVWVHFVDNECIEVGGWHGHRLQTTYTVFLNIKSILCDNCGFTALRLANFWMQWLHVSCSCAPQNVNNICLYYYVYVIEVNEIQKKTLRKLTCRVVRPLPGINFAEPLYEKLHAWQTCIERELE